MKSVAAGAGMALALVGGTQALLPASWPGTQAAASSARCTAPVCKMEFQVPKLDFSQFQMPNFFSPPGQASKSEPRAQALVQRLFGSGQIDVDEIVDACAEAIVWEDMSGDTANGLGQVKSLIQSKFPAGSFLAVERMSDGDGSGGFTWHREADGKARSGLRGTMFLELDDEGKIAYVCEGCEPLFKPGELTEKLLKAVTANVDQEEVEQTYQRRQTRGAADVVKYLWQEAYPGGAKPDEAVRCFSEDIRYEDFNYPEPFLGKEQVTEFVTAFDIPGLEFEARRISEGDRACCFTWIVKVAGADGPKGISFYETDAAGKVCFVRDIPAPSLKPPPLLSIASIVNPQLRVFTERE